MFRMVVAHVLLCALCLHSTSAFLSSPLITSRQLCTGRSAQSSLQLRMNAEDDSGSRRRFLHRVGLSGAALVSSLTSPPPAFATRGEYAKIDMTGKKGVSGLGENDLPAAGKIDPYDNREQANAEYAARMTDPARIAQKKEEATALKEKIMSATMAAIERKDWKEAKLILNRDTLPLRRAMNEVSTKGERAVSAAQRGGDPEKAKTEVEKAEREFLMSVNRLAVGLDGDRSKVDFDRVNKAAAKAEKDWTKWLSLSE